MARTFACGSTHNLVHESVGEFPGKELQESTKQCFSERQSVSRHALDAESEQAFSDRCLPSARFTDGKVQENGNRQAEQTNGLPLHGAEFALRNAPAVGK